MEYYAGIDVSLEQSSVCVVDAGGKIVREAKVGSDPEALSVFFQALGLPLVRIGLESGGRVCLDRGPRFLGGFSAVRHGVSLSGRPGGRA